MRRQRRRWRSECAGRAQDAVNGLEIPCPVTQDSEHVQWTHDSQRTRQCEQVPRSLASPVGWASWTHRTYGAHRTQQFFRAHRTHRTSRSWTRPSSRTWIQRRDGHKPDRSTVPRTRERAGRRRREQQQPDDEQDGEWILHVAEQDGIHGHGRRLPFHFCSQLASQPQLQHPRRPAYPWPRQSLRSYLVHGADESAADIGWIFASSVLRPHANHAHWHRTHDG